MQTNPNMPANAAGVVFTVICGLVLLALPRRYAIFPVIVICCYMTMEQSVVVAGCHFTMVRILMLMGWIRILVRGELRGIRLNSLDRSVLCCTAVSCVAYVILWHDGDALTYKLGAAYNILGYYFLFRILLRDLDDVVRIFRMMAVLIVPLAAFMLLEKSTGRNMFSVFGGVSAVTAVRDGVLRCNGPFSHPILAGTFGATVMPLVASLWVDGGMGKFLALCGVISATIIAIASGSSGPVLAMMAGVLALCLWPMREKMQLIRRGCALGIVCLQMVMKVPVWFLLARVDVFSGSTGFHRAMLIDGAFRHLGDWWLVGTKSTLAWADQEQGLFDVTNQYLVVGAEGGLFSMLLFIWIIVCAFRYVGLARRAMDQIGEPLANQGFVWVLGVSLFTHVVSYISVSYFDQNFVNWYLLLAMIAAVWEQFRVASAEQESEAMGEQENSAGEKDLVTVESGSSIWWRELTAFPFSRCAVQ